MFRCVHPPSFDRTARRLLASIPNLDLKDASDLAALSVALRVGIGSSRSKQWRQALHEIEQLQSRLFHLCEKEGLFDLSFSLALTLEIYRLLFASQSSPASAWLAVGRASFGASLAGLHQQRCVRFLFDTDCVAQRKNSRSPSGKGVLGGILKYASGEFASVLDAHGQTLAASPTHRCDDVLLRLCASSTPHL
jgi:hypothetical protein